MAPRSVLPHAVVRTFVSSWTTLNGVNWLATSKSSRYRGKQADGSRSPWAVARANCARSVCTIPGSQLAVFFAEPAWREFWRKFGASCGRARLMKVGTLSPLFEGPVHDELPQGFTELRVAVDSGPLAEQSVDPPRAMVICFSSPQRENPVIARHLRVVPGHYDSLS
jgi:hypothetical protein